MADGGTLDEFGLIQRFFVSGRDFPSAWPSQGIGDDCAFLDIGDRRIAVSADMMALGSHFLEDADPYCVGRKALAVNLSDLAAAGARPQAFFLCLGLPEADPVWLGEFSRGLMEEAQRYGCPLRGGDTTRTPKTACGRGRTTISITVLGDLAPGTGLTRRGARPGDDVWISGQPGEAFAALASIWNLLEVSPEFFPALKARMDLPAPRVTLGRHLIGLASACADISDGLAGDLGHITEASGVGAALEWAAFPLSEALRSLPEAWQQRCVLAGGDDYELVFTAPAEKREQIAALAPQAGCALTRVGRITAGSGVTVYDAEGRALPPLPSFNHFAEP